MYAWYSKKGGLTSTTLAFSTLPLLNLVTSLLGAKDEFGCGNKENEREDRARNLETTLQLKYSRVD